MRSARGVVEVDAEGLRDVDVYRGEDLGDRGRGTPLCRAPSSSRRRLVCAGVQPAAVAVLITASKAIDAVDPSLVRYAQYPVRVRSCTRALPRTWHAIVANASASRSPWVNTAICALRADALTLAHSPTRAARSAVGTARAPMTAPSSRMVMRTKSSPWIRFASCVGAVGAWVVLVKRSMISSRLPSVARTSST
ncbi:hypothetical protein H351_02895 [Rhodococcus erythropolis R138]|nr:hypothetical protein H351_02895 [Rhodococcus erythropolis R138]